MQQRGSRWNGKLHPLQECLYHFGDDCFKGKKTAHYKFTCIVHNVDQHVHTEAPLLVQWAEVGQILTRFGTVGPNDIWHIQRSSEAAWKSPWGKGIFPSPTLKCSLPAAEPPSAALPAECLDAVLAGWTPVSQPMLLTHWVCKHTLWRVCTPSADAGTTGLVD